MHWKYYLLSRCCCQHPVRVRYYDRRPDYCAACGGWLTPIEPDDEDPHRTAAHDAYAMYLTVLLLLVVIGWALYALLSR